MAAGRLVYVGFMPAIDPDGIPYPDAKFTVYVNRTTTLAVVYADEALTTPLANPVEADSSGQFPPVWQDDGMLFSASISSQAQPLAETIDDLAPSTSVGGAANKLDRDGGNPEPDFLTNVGAASIEALTLVGGVANDAIEAATLAGGVANDAITLAGTKLDPDGSNADAVILENIPYVADAGVSRPVADKFAETPSVLDYGGATGATIKAAIAEGGTKGKPLILPGGKVGAPLNYNLSTVLGAGDQTTFVVTGPLTYSGSQAAAGIKGKGVWFGGTGVANGAAADPMYVGAMPDAAGKFWAQDQYFTLTGRGNTMGASTFVGTSYFGAAAGLFASRTSDDPTPGAPGATREGCMGIWPFVINNKADLYTSAYAIYAESIRTSGSGTVHLMEGDIINFGNLVDVRPNNMFTAGQTTGLWIASGGFVASALPASAAIGVVGNLSTWRRGLVFDETGLVDLGDGSREAISFGRKHFMAQYASGVGAGLVNRISFEGTSDTAGTDLLFSDAGAAFLNLTTRANRLNVNSSGFTFGPSGSEWAGYNSGVFTVGPVSDPWIYATSAGLVGPKAAFFSRVGSGEYSMRVTPVSSAVNYWNFSGSSSGNPVRVQAQGSDSNIDVRLEPKGSGLVWLGPVAGSADAPVAGYIQVRGFDGAVYKVALIA